MAGEQHPVRPSRIVIDTNVFVAAGFRPDSASGRLLDEVWSSRLVLVWNAETRRETEYVVRKIPHLSWERFVHCFRQEGCIDLETDPTDYDFISDPEDRKFAALAQACGVPLVTSDEHLLRVRNRLAIPVLTPGEWFHED